MRKGLLGILVVAVLCSGAAMAQGPKADVFKGKLFPPNVILENQDQLNLTKDQYTAIRAAVVEVQENVAEHEWDVRDAYRSLMAELDQTPIDETQVMAYVDEALAAENAVKREQVMMLIKLKNLLDDEQIAYLESVRK
ncbi:MAG: hypothetical protein AAF351_14285 [Pseudomonadota bacterium]